MKTLFLVAAAIALAASVARSQPGGKPAKKNPAKFADEESR